MKLNKKGFGVAEIAIVVLLIGILAAAVIAGFMGIKKNANDVADEQGKIAQTMSNDLKHTFPTILSTDLKNGLRIKEGEYEVYELGGYKLAAGTSVNGALYVEKNATLFVSGNGTLDDTSKIAGSNRVKEAAINNYGNLTLSDLIITGGTIYNKNSRYQLTCSGQSVTTLNNVKITGANGTISVGSKAKLYINGTNTTVIYPYQACHSGCNLFYISYSGEVVINEGTFIVRDGNNKYFALQGGTLTINGGEFRDEEYAVSSSVIDIEEIKINGDFYEVNVEINGGVFNCASQTAFINIKSTDYDSGKAISEYKGKVTITGGEFVTKPPKFVKNNCTDSDGVVEIKDAPNDGTEQLIFHYAPSVGWGQYVAEGYEPYEIVAGARWGVRPVTTP